MKVIVHVRPKSKQAKVEKIDEGQYRVWVRTAPERGKANIEMIKLLADHFQVPKYSIRIVIGKTAREKLVEVIGVGE